MMLKSITIAVGLALALSVGTATAQTDTHPIASQQGIAGPQKRAGQGKRAQINADVRAGRITKSQGRQLKQQLKAQRARRRAQKQARQSGPYQPPNQPSVPQ